MSIASRVIEKCGSGDFSKGVPLVAQWAGVDISRVHRWTYPKAKGGTDGIIPARHQPKILDEAIAAGVTLEPADFFPKSEDEAGDLAADDAPEQADAA